nr:FHA domain-containing protein [Desulfobacterales bacterium]
VGGGFLLTDLQSKNGTFVNEQKVSSHYLNNNDVILIGKHSLVFAYRATESRPADTVADMDRTMIMDTGKYKEMMKKNASEKIKSKEGTLSILSGNKEEIRLTKKITRIGKADDSDITVGGLLTGRTAATISKRPSGYFLSYVEGMNKPKVNGDTVTGSVQLKEFDMIFIGSGRMQFIYKS